MRRYLVLLTVALLVVSAGVAMAQGGGEVNGRQKPELLSLDLMAEHALRSP